MSNFRATLKIFMACTVLVGYFAFNTPYLYADEGKIEVTDANALKAALEKLAGKSVTLKLGSGEELSGVLEAVGPSALKLGQLTGKEFYSAIVQISEVSVVIYRAKT